VETMTDTSIAIGSGSPLIQQTGRLGQATRIEQTRAVAEVMAQVEVAQRMPRDMERAIRQMQTSCRQPSLAERAFYRYPKGKNHDGSSNMITGPSVHLARELARCFGNVQYGLVELSRDLDQSEMMVFAWDVETNSRSCSTFIVPHRRDTKNGQIELTDLREIYENNANQAARRLREAIFSIMPPWFTEDAKELCAQTLQGGKDASGKVIPPEVRAARAVDKFARAYGIRKEQLETKMGARITAWTEYDLAALSVIFRSLERGEARVEDEFPAHHTDTGDAKTDDPRNTNGHTPPPVQRETITGAVEAQAAVRAPKPPQPDNTRSTGGGAETWDDVPPSTMIIPDPKPDDSPPKGDGSTVPDTP
jgi:hypothetical protein